MKLITQRFVVPDYDLAATLTSGQAFRWRLINGGWESVVSGRWVRLVQTSDAIEVTAREEDSDWLWLKDYLQLHVDLAEVIAAFPADEPMRESVAACRGLRLLKQEPWECLASFILSSTKQIVQIQQIVDLLCRRYGETLELPDGSVMHAFPTAARLASCTEQELRDCKMGFRARYLLGSAQMIAEGKVDLETLRRLSCAEARERLLELPGVGRKIADCVLLFAYGFPEAFPVDVWIYKAIQQLYFPKRHVKIKRLMRFAETHFLPHSGYAQQYLFHYMRTRVGRSGTKKS